MAAARLISERSTAGRQLCPAHGRSLNTRCPTEAKGSDAVTAAVLHRGAQCGHPPARALRSVPRAQIPSGKLALQPRPATPSQPFRTVSLRQGTNTATNPQTRAPSRPAPCGGAARSPPGGHGRGPAGGGQQRTPPKAADLWLTAGRQTLDK